LSAGADGLLKLWTIRTNECECTIDGHNDKVWAMDIASNGSEIVTGGADSQLVVWGDTTQEVVQIKQAEAETNIILNQKLDNHLRRKEFDQALDLALQRERPQMALKILTSIVETDFENGGNGLGVLIRIVKEWSMERLTQVLRYCREWNTRARNSHIALIVVKAILSSFPVHKLAAEEGVAEVIAGIIPYSERHFERLSRLYANSFVIDFILTSMGALDSVDKVSYRSWEMTSTPLESSTKAFDGRIQIGGKTVVGHNP
jgi:U3 small nucleolar RNA-associated protein 13